MDLTSVEEIDLPEPGTGEVMVRTTYLQITAVMADLMRENPGLPMPGYRVGEPMWAPVVGTVADAGDTALPAGAQVAHRMGWQDHAVVAVNEVYPLPTSLPEPFYALNQRVTAYHGIVDIAEVTPDDVVFVSGAAAGVGSLAGQIAKALDAKKVIGSAGSAAKVAYLVDGKIVYPRTVLGGGIEAAAKVLDDLLAGKHRGNVILRIAQ